MSKPKKNNSPHNNNNDNDRKLTNMPEDDVTSTTEDNAVEDSIPTKVERKVNRGIGVAISVILSTTALAASGYLFINQNNRNQALDSKISTIASSLDALRINQTNNKKKLEQAVNRQLSETQSLKSSLARLSSRVENTQASWSIEEINQLLQLAVDQLSLAGNIDGAMKALQIADQRIAASGDASIQAVRQVIAKDIARLQQVERIDLAGTVHRLRAVEQTIDKLPTGKQTYIPDAAAPSDKNEQNSTFLQQLKEDLSGLVRIRHIDQPEHPLLSVEQNYFLRDNAKALLLAARISVMRADAENYRSSLQQLSKLVEKYFDTSSKKSQWVLNELVELTRLNPAPLLPDISSSLNSLSGINEGASK